ncbi:MAG TPA: amidohydrolase family protein [Alphaproteobacteria bacterium]|nr:amidohydrolase family protein [Alphaproteobacteria bacterium]
MTRGTKRPYRLISSDSHLTEPGDLWVKRVPASLRDRAPRIVSLDQGDGWLVEGIAEPFSFGLTSCAGLPPEEMRAWIRFEEMRKGGWDPAARVQEMDRDDVDGEVLFPTPRLQIALVANSDEAWHIAMLRAYNDWLSEYVAHAPDRFCGLALLPNRGGAKAAVAELERVVGRPGMRGAMIGCWPNGTLTLQPEDDFLWAALAERGIPLTIHVSLAQALPPTVTKMKLPGYGRFFDAPNRMIEMVFSGMFDRFPTLDVFFAEVDFGWVPYVVEQIENNYRRLEPTSNFGLKKSPRAYIERHFHFGYMTDTFGLQNRHHVGAERILWSSDYPHISADWPFSWRTIQSSLSGASAVERALILRGNAERLFGFGRD